MKIKARDYQKECLVEIAQAVEQGEKRALVVMAPGLGKTITSAFAVKEFFAGREFSRVLILCHSEEILRQSKVEYQKFFGEEYSYGMYVSNEKTTRQTDFLFATFQTMKGNRKDFPKEAFSYIIVDEAHHSKAQTYFPTIRYFKPKFLLGLTATPDRLDGQKIEEIYGEPVYELDFVEATCRGLLAKCDYELVLDDLSQEDIDKYLDSDEKLSIAQLNNTIFAPKRDEEIVRLIKKYSAEQEDPKTMIFCKSIEHARRIAKLMGDGATLVHNGQSNSTNDIALDAFRDGKIQTIISVQMLNEGINVPDANVIVFLRNTVSPSIFYQQLGRGVRPAPGKKSVKVLDFVGNCERIQTILELKQRIDDFRVRTPVEKTCNHGDGEADSREKFVLNIATPEFKSRMVDIVELLGQVQNKQHWDADTIVKFIQQLGASLNRAPHVSDLQDCESAPSLHAIISHCKSFNHALELAGFEPYSRLSRKDAMRLLTEQSVNGSMPLRGLFDNNPELPWSSTIMRALGAQNWVDAARMVELEVVDMAGKDLTYDEQERLLLFHACRYYEESIKAGHWLTAKEVNLSRELISFSTYTRLFKSMFNLRNKAIEACCSSDEEIAILTQNGKIENRKSSGRSSTGISKDYIIAGIQRLTEEVQRRPTINDIDSCDYLPKYSYIQHKIGNLKNIYKICRVDAILLSIGVEPEIPRNSVRSRTESEITVFQIQPDGKPCLVEDKKLVMQEFVRKTGRRLKKRDLCGGNGLPSESTFRRYGITMSALNTMINADAILAELNATS